MERTLLKTSLKHSKILITGGAGFIGSHMVDAFMPLGGKVVALDNLSKGRLENFARWFDDSSFRFIKGDLLNLTDIEDAINDCDIVFHLAANPEVRVGAVNTKIDYEQNILATYNLLEIIRKSGSCKQIVFASSSTVYGEAKVVPTPEDYGPLKPISLYGASKLACEALISGYAYMFGLKSAICRLANIVGSRSTHTIIYDFIRKLKANPKVLEVLGDGTQSKSYIYVEDCIEAFLIAAENISDPVEIYNIGSEDKVNVLTIAEIVTEEMGLNEVKIRCTGGVDGGRGWKGDVKEMLLDVSKLKRHGWQPKYESLEAVRAATRNILKETDKYNK